MGLNISTGGGEDFKPYIKYDAKAGRWHVKKDGGLVEVEKPSFAADFDNIKTGWFDFQPGLAPNVMLDPDLSTQVAKPSERHKRGFEIELFSPNFGGVVVFSSTAGVVGEAINAIYEQYEKAKGANVGSLPVVQCSGVEGIVGKHGTNYKPTLSILKWIPRPDGFSVPAKTGAIANVTAAMQQAPAPVAPAASAVSEW